MLHIPEESDSDSETWPHQNTSDIKEEHVIEEIEDIKKETNSEDTHEEVDEKDKSKTAVLQKVIYRNEVAIHVYLCICI